MADVKDEISPTLVATLGADLAAAWPEFDRSRFETLATTGLTQRELKARIALIADALAATLPEDVADADRVIRSALDAGGLQWWASLPVNDYVAATMIDHPGTALPLLAALTPRFSAEFAIRPFVEAHPDLTMHHLRLWASNSDEHVRRLVSESTRPRLPWAPLLRGFVADPSPTIALLDMLFDDESQYVRRSVANHLNDVSKDHPELAVTTATRWLGASTHGDHVARHALRTLVKNGHIGALAALGFGHGNDVELVELTCAPTTLAIGESTTITISLRALQATRAAIDYVVHYQGANGPKSGKVFKLAVRDLPAATPVTLQRRQRFEHVSIRRIHPGLHRIDVRVNGQDLGTTTIDVTS